ncbi:flavin-containing monooxygenase [Desertimonas flava]|uniref:flavin-containing monooxygenase n=1 Tax=Desertimonas flava TaxID=2064846 RepID=UPI000E348296|nr:NAD(P)/FAD-dependent oxidoreductase [Desertimonas flava]
MSDPFSDDELTAAIESADPVALRAALWIQTQLASLIAMPTGRPSGVTHLLPPIELLDDHDVARVRADAAAFLRAHLAGGSEPRTPQRAQIATIVEMLTGDAPAEATHEFWWEEFAAEPLSRRADPIDRADLDATFPELRVVIIGSGMGGISAAVMLQAAGIPFTIIEKNAALGGTWHSNTYPGVRVDVPSRAYSFTFEPDYPWQHHFAPQEELLHYLEHTVERRDIGRHIVFGTEVTKLTWAEHDRCWVLETRRADGTTGVERAQFVVSAVGLFSRPREANFEGLDSFRGMAMHTSEWDHSCEVTGRRVGVVGTGSSGIQVVRPLSEVAAHLTVFQRTANWLGHAPRYTEPVAESERWLIERFPFYVHCVRVIQIYARGDARQSLIDVDPDWDDPDSVSAPNAALRTQLLEYLRTELDGHPDLIERCTPAFPALAKRLPMDNGWYRALREDHVALETRHIRRVVADGVELDDGDVVPLDVLVLATGFRATDFLWPMEIVGVGGVTLSDVWEADGARAYLGIMVPGFPNLFCSYGPNTNPTTGGPCMWGEFQARFVVEAIGALARSGHRSMEVRRDVFDDYNARLDEALSTKVWLDPRQTSYITNEHGRVTTNAPWKTHQYWQWTRRPDLDEYILDGTTEER